MTNFTDMNILTENLIVYWLGDFSYLGYLMVIILLGFLYFKNVPFELGLIITLPIAGGVVLFFGTNIAFISLYILILSGYYADNLNRVYS